MTTICIGVPSYRRADQLSDLLKRLVPLLIARPHIRLCVANDGSHDAAYERVLAPYTDIVDYRILPVNGGCGAARRAAFEGATEDYLVCIDDDCIPSREWLDWLEALIEAHPSVDLFAGDVRPYFEESPGDWERALSILDENTSPVVLAHGLLTAVTANLAMKRETYELSGGFAADLRGTEDCDITQKLIGAGASYMVVNDWVIFHIAKLRFGAVARRFRKYGADAASYTVSRKLWKLSARHGAGSLRQAAMRGVDLFQYQRRRDAQDKALSGKARFFRSIVIGLLTFAFEYGWWRRMRGLGIRDMSQLAKPPVLAERYVTFSPDDAAAFKVS